MTPVCGPGVQAFVERGIFPQGRTFGPCQAIGFERDGNLVAGFVFHNWEPSTGAIEVSGYSIRRDWVNKKTLKMIFEYPFEICRCRIVVARHSEKNKRAIRIWNALGAVQTHIPELRGPNEAEVVAVLTRDAWQNSKFMR